MNQEQQIRYIANPAWSPAAIETYRSSYLEVHGNFPYHTVEDKERMALRLIQKKACKPKIQTPEQKEASNLRSRIRAVAYKEHDKGYTVTYMAMHKKEMQESRNAYFKANVEAFVVKYEEDQNQKRIEKMREYKRKYNKAWAQRNPVRAKASRDRQIANRTPEQTASYIAYQKEYRATHKKEAKVYNKKYKTKHKDRLKALRDNTNTI